MDVSYYRLSPINDTTEAASESDVEPRDQEQSIRIKDVCVAILADYQTRFQKINPSLNDAPVWVPWTNELIVLLNGFVWMVMGFVLRSSPSLLLPTVVISYSLGLRHALEADQVLAVDVMIRQVAAGGQRYTVGLYFLTGHLSIVLLTVVILAAKFHLVVDDYSHTTITGVVGKSVSLAALLVLSAMHVYRLHKLIRQVRRVLRMSPFVEAAWELDGKGIQFKMMMKRCLPSIDRPWKMFPFGALFGLRLSMLVEVVLLGVLSVHGTTARIEEFRFSLFFLTGTMCLTYTANSFLLLVRYIHPVRKPCAETKVLQRCEEKERFARDPLAFLYPAIILTGLAAIMAIVVGIVDLVGETTRYSGVAGVAVFAFASIGLILGMTFYWPWRMEVERRRRRRRGEDDPWTR